MINKFVYVALLIAAAVVMPMAQAEITYFHTDLLGSPAVTTNEQGAVISRTHYQPFGEAIEGVQQSVGYTGHQYDGELGLTYAQARYYDPVIGRFYGNDPIGVRDLHSFNRYAYGNNNPFKFVDPDGRAPKWLPKLLKTGSESLSESAVNLRKSLASDSQLANAKRGVSDKTIASADTINDLPRILAEYGGNSKDWKKLSSEGYRAPDGQVISTHWYSNSELGLNVEFKNIISEYSKKGAASALEGGASLLGILAVASEMTDFTVYISSPPIYPAGAIEGPWYCFGCYTMDNGGATNGK